MKPLILLLMLGSISVKAEQFVVRVTPFQASTLKTLPRDGSRPDPTRMPKHLIKCLSQLEFTYRYKAFDQGVRRGVMVVNNDLVDDLKVILRKMFAEPAFAFHSVQPMHHFDWDDNKSMRANNTSGFNYRYIANTTKLSNHATGRAIDINPRVNPWVGRNGMMKPANGTTDPNAEGSLLPGSRAHYLVELFKSRGFVWGGDWNSLKDYQHFEKRIRYPGNQYCLKPHP